MGKIIAFIIVILLAVGAWYMFSQTSDTVTPTTETVNEPINEARELQEQTSTPRPDTTLEQN